jgi:antitoxin component of RelBE/YafQ-DinJ toxin-antitoxin module
LTIPTDDELQFLTTTIKLEIPENVERDARAVAERTGSRIEDVLSEWLDRYAAELPLDLLSDERILELCDSQLPQSEQDELSDLLGQNRENTLSAEGQIRLDELMHTYRRGLTRKAEAHKIAVQRGLLPPLG